MKLQCGRFTYSPLNESCCLVTDFLGEEANVTVPRTLDGYTVMCIGMGAFIRNQKLKTVVLPETVTKIDNMAFHGCKALEEIRIPDSVTEICYNAFSNCESLRVQIGKGAKNILSGAFVCVRHIDVSAENPYFCAVDGNLYSKDKTVFLQYTRKESEVSFSVPDGVERVGVAAFSHCAHLTEIRLPESLRTVGWSAFEDCKGLTRMTLPDGLTVLDGGAFTNCAELKEISVGVGLQSLGNSVFDGCFSLEKLRYGGTMTQWRSITLGNFWSDGAPCLRVETAESASEREDGSPSPHLDYTVNANGNTCTVSGIGLCTDRKLVFPTEIDGYTVTGIGKSEPWDSCFHESYIDFEGSFEGRGDVESVFVPDGVTCIGDCAFKNCAALKSVWISGSVRTIGSSAFEGCTALESVFLGDGVECIFANAFRECTALKEVHLPESVNTVFEGAFAGGVANITVSPENPFFASLDGNLYSKDMKTLLQYAAGKPDTAFRCPASVTAIGIRAFLSCHALTDVVLGENVESIGSEAFLCCVSLVSINVPDSVKTIDPEAFSGCVKLSRPRFGNGLTYLGASAFAHCASLRSNPLCDGITAIKWGAFSFCISVRKVRVPDTVRKISERAFEACYALREVSLPAGLEYLDEEAFRHCKNLRTVSFRGTAAQWKALFQGECLSAVRTVLCTDGAVVIGGAEKD